MASYPPRLQRLIDALRILPGVGPKSAQRMAFQLLERDRPGARLLAERLVDAIEGIGRCERCRMFSETPLCELCDSPQRDSSLLCVVETPGDVLAVEHSGAYRGRYFVLMGRLSPLDGIGPDELQIDALDALLAAGGVEEVVLATGATVEGEATAHFVAAMAGARGIVATRIAHGVPMGGELEYVDGSTLAHAFNGRLGLSRDRA